MHAPAVALSAFIFASNHLSRNALSSPLSGSPNTPVMASPTTPYIFGRDFARTWGTERKYGERASPCGSSASSMDSRFSEGFRSFERCQSRSPSPLGYESPPSVSDDPAASPTFNTFYRFKPLNFTKHESRLHKRPRGDPSDEPTEAGSKGGGSSQPGPLNPREAYFKTRQIIRAYLKTARPDSADQSSSCASIVLNDGELPATEGATSSNILNVRVCSPPPSSS